MLALTSAPARITLSNHTGRGGDRHSCTRLVCCKNQLTDHTLKIAPTRTYKKLASVLAIADKQGRCLSQVTISINSHVVRSVVHLKCSTFTNTNTSLPQIKLSAACLSATVSAALPQMILMQQGLLLGTKLRPINARVAGNMPQSTKE